MRDNKMMLHYVSHKIVRGFVRQAAARTLQALLRAVNPPLDPLFMQRD